MTTLSLSRPAPWLRRLSLVLAGTLVLLGAALLAGFLWFVHLTDRAGAPPQHADGIVALTGGADRVRAAFRLLEAGRARLLLISGVAHGTQLADLTRQAGLHLDRLAGRVTLGHDATSTHGNAVETRDWALVHGVHSLIVVTAGYHMPRALTELHRALPEVTLYPAPVRPPAMRSGFDWTRLRVLSDEYVKWLGAQIGLSVLEQGLPQEARLG